MHGVRIMKHIRENSYKIIIFSSKLISLAFKLTYTFHSTQFLVAESKANYKHQRERERGREICSVDTGVRAKILFAYKKWHVFAALYFLDDRKGKLTRKESD